MGALIDIKQRAILVGTDQQGNSVVCAEPSPDSLSSYLSETLGKLEVTDKGSASFERKLAENAAFVGLRTQSIQLLRDSYYRLCEAYMNKAITKADYDIQMRRYQQYMITLLAIEALTGVVNVPQTATTPSYLHILSLQLPKLLTEQKQLQGMIAEEEKKGEQKDKDKIKKLEGQVAEIKSNYSKIVSKLTQQETSRSPIPGKTSGVKDSISSSVRSMVGEVLQSDYYGQLCWSLFTKKEFKLNELDSEIKNACARFFRLKNQDYQKAIVLREKKLHYRIQALEELKKFNNQLKQI